MKKNLLSAHNAHRICFLLNRLSKKVSTAVFRGNFGCLVEMLVFDKYVVRSLKFLSVFLYDLNFAQ